MKFIEDLKAGEVIVEHYLCRKKQTLKSKAGKSYYSLTLSDKTGQIEAKVWDINNYVQDFEEKDFIKIEGEVQEYSGTLQLKVMKIRKSNEGEYETMNYIPTTEKDINEIFTQIKDLINSFENIYLKQLLENIILKNEVVSANFTKHSAAKAMHHPYMGGLAEHTLNVAQIADFLAPRYKNVNRDLLMAGALLHDIGKIFELSPFPDNDYTDEGQLLGHIVILTELITKESQTIENFPEKLKDLLKHSILSHHGEYIYGSPKRPKTIEAFILHCADNTDAKIKMFEEMIAKDKTTNDWLGYNRMLERNIRKSNY